MNKINYINIYLNESFQLIILRVIIKNSLNIIILGLIYYIVNVDYSYKL